EVEAWVQPCSQNLAIEGFDRHRIRLITAALLAWRQPREAHRLGPRGALSNQVVELTSATYARKQRPLDRQVQGEPLQSVPARQASAGFNCVVKECHALSNPSCGTRP